MDEGKDHPNILAIDFGTTRIKSAIFNPQTRSVEVLPIGDDEKRYIPSIFHIDIDGLVSFGDSASELLVHDPMGTLANVKLNLDNLHRAANGNKIESIDLLKVVFQKIVTIYRSYFPSYFENNPLDLVLTLPSRWYYQDIYTEAVDKADIKYNRLSFIKEPVAAAHYLKFQEKDKTSGPLIIIDFGGGTVDWALISIEEDRLELVPQCPPSGLEGAGFEIDKEIYGVLTEKISSISNIHMEEIKPYVLKNKALLLNYIRKIKERIRFEKSGSVIFRLKGTKIEIDAQTLNNTLAGESTQRIINKSMNYISKAMRHTSLPIKCVLAGGGGLFPGFVKSLSSKVNKLSEETGREISVNSLTNPHYATVMGAVYFHLSKSNLYYLLGDSNKSKSSPDKGTMVKPDSNDTSLVKKFFDPDAI